MSFTVRKKNKSQAKRSLIPNIITQTNKNLKINYTNYLNNFKNKIFSKKKSPQQKALTPSQRPKKIYLSKDKNFLPPKSPEFLNKKTLILDLDETLVHSSFEPFSKSDIILNVNFDGIYYKIYVLVRPGAKEFIKKISKYFELVIFTASISKYASPLLDILDKDRNIQFRLYRENCNFLNGIYIKPLKKIGRNMKDIIIVDNSPLAYAFDSDNGLPISSWFEDKNDKELFDIMPLLIFLSKTNDVRKYIEKFVDLDKINYNKALKIIEEEKSKEIIDISNNININIDLNNNICVCDDNKKNLEIKIEDKNININNIGDILSNNISYNKSDKNIFNSKNNLNNKININTCINTNIFPLKNNILSSNKINNPKLVNNNNKIKPLKSLENTLLLNQNLNINLNKIEVKIPKIKKDKNTFNKDKYKDIKDFKDEHNLKLVSNRHSNINITSNYAREKTNFKLFLNLPKKNSKDKKKNDFKSSIKNSKSKLSINKGLTLGNSHTTKNIFSKNKKSNFISNFSLYKKNKNNSNINLFTSNNNKILNLNSNTINAITAVNHLNQNTYNFNSKYNGLLNQYNQNQLNKNNKNSYMSFRNNTTIFPEFKNKSKNNTYYSLVINKDKTNSKNNIRKELFNKKDKKSLKSKSTENFYKNFVNNNMDNLNKNENNKIDTEIIRVNSKKRDNKVINDDIKKLINI